MEMRSCYLLAVWIAMRRTAKIEAHQHNYLLPTILHSDLKDTPVQNDI